MWKRNGFKLILNTCFTSKLVKMNVKLILVFVFLLIIPFVYSSDIRIIGNSLLTSASGTASAPYNYSDATYGMYGIWFYNMTPVGGGSDVNHTIETHASYSWTWINWSILDQEWVLAQGYGAGSDVNHTTETHGAYAKYWNNQTSAYQQLFYNYTETFIDTNFTTECGDGEYGDGAGFCRSINDTIDDRTASTTYQPINVSTYAGTHEQGNLTSLWILDDGDYYNVSEVGGANPIGIVINFTGVSDIDFMLLNVFYEGGSGHQIAIGLFDWDDGDYEEEYGDIGDMGEFELLKRDVFDAGEHIDPVTGNVSLRLRHIDNGNPSHILHLDYVVLVDGFTTLTNTKHDSLSGRNLLDNHPQYIDINNQRNGTLNITSLCDVTNVCYSLSELNFTGLNDYNHTLTIHEGDNIYSKINNFTNKDDSHESFYVDYGRIFDLKINHTEIEYGGQLDVNGVSFWASTLIPVGAGAVSFGTPSNFWGTGWFENINITGGYLDVPNVLIRNTLNITTIDPVEMDNLYSRGNHTFASGAGLRIGTNQPVFMADALPTVGWWFMVPRRTALFDQNGLELTNFSLESAGGISTIGTIIAGGNIQARTNYFSADGTGGWTGTFAQRTGGICTVKNGLITNCNP